MAIQDDFTIDVVDRKITMDTAFVDDRPVSIYTVNELYSYLQDTFDEPGFMQYSVPMSAQTPTQYTLINGWFMDDNSMKALYGGSIQTSGWTHTGSEGITAVRWASATAAPDSTDVGKAVTGTSGATGVILYVDVSPSTETAAARNVVWIRNTNATAFTVSDVIDDDATGTNPDFTLEPVRGAQTGETVWANLFSVGSKTVTTEIFVGQEDDYLGGRAYHGADAEAQARRRVEKIDEWWDTDVNFLAGSPNLLGGVDHFDILVKTREAGVLVDSGKLLVSARQFGTVYSHFELTAAAAGNFVVPFASTGADLNSAEGPYSCDFSANSGTITVGDIIENNTGTSPVGRLRAVITGGTTLGSATGTIEYYLIGENEPLATTDRTLKQWSNGDFARTRGGSPTFTINSVPAEVTNGPAQAQGITITFANAQRDINEDTTDEEYACVIDCNNVLLQDVYQYTQFLTSRGNQDGSTPDTQDLLLPTAIVATDEAGEFYRAVGDITVPWNARTGTAPAEGVFVVNANTSWTASGVVVALSNSAGASGQLTLTQVKGTWSNSDTVSVVGAAATNFVTINGTPSAISDNTGAPFGTFAGGRWFVARGVVLDNVPTADANNWQTVNLTGSVVTPPTVRQITFAGLIANDRAGLFEVGTPGGSDIVKTHNTWSSGGALGASTFTVSGGIDLDVPTDGWVRHVDDSSTVGAEYRYDYGSYVVGTGVVTLRTVSPGDDVADAGGSTTILNDTNIGLAYGTDGNTKTGMMIRNVTTGEIATVLRRITDNSIETTPVPSGWTTSDAYELNTIVVAMAASDTVYWPFIDDEATGTSLTALVKYVGNTDLIARTRFSDPDVGGTRILPFEQFNVTLEDANLTVTAIRTTDTIAT